MTKLQHLKKLSLSLLVFTALVAICQQSQALTPLSFTEKQLKHVNRNVKKISQQIITEKQTTKPPTPKEIFQTLTEFLEEITKGCDESTKIQAGVNYRICTINDEPVKASEALLEVGDGIGYWFHNNQVVAIQYFHSGETLFFNDGKLIVKFYYDEEMQDTFTDEEHREAENLAKDGYQSIFKVFVSE